MGLLLSDEPTRWQLANQLWAHGLTSQTKPAHPAAPPEFARTTRNCGWQEQIRVAEGPDGCVHLKW
jgi:hypothetical protein